MKEVDVELIMNDGNANLITPKITGELVGIYLSNQEKSDIAIVSELGYKIYQENQRMGSDYFPLKFSALNQHGHQFAAIAENIFLNEKLLIYVNGIGKIRIILRYK